jgi:hypothetical protein
MTVEDDRQASTAEPAKEKVSRGLGFYCSLIAFIGTILFLIPMLFTTEQLLKIFDFLDDHPAIDSKLISITTMNIFLIITCGFFGFLLLTARMIRMLIQWSKEEPIGYVIYGIIFLILASILLPVLTTKSEKINRFERSFRMAKKALAEFNKYLKDNNETFPDAGQWQEYTGHENMWDLLNYSMNAKLSLLKKSAADQNMVMLFEHDYIYRGEKYQFLGGKELIPQYGNYENKFFVILVNDKIIAVTPQEAKKLKW